MPSQSQNEFLQPLLRRYSTRQNKRLKLTPTNVDEVASTRRSPTLCAYNPSFGPPFLEAKTGRDTDELQMCDATLSDLKLVSHISSPAWAGEDDEGGSDGEICFGMV